MTIEIIGTGGIIEGDLGAANVNVNLDAALDFDGTDDFVDLNYGNGVNTQAGFSVSAFIKKDSLGTNQMWMGSNNGSDQRFYIGIRNDYFAFGYADEGWALNVGKRITAGDWYHVCVTATSGAQKLYVNGVEITASAKTVSDAFTLASDLRIGRLGTANNYNWDGKITDVKIFGDVLTAAEVQELASKINYDISVGSIDNLTRWFKSNAGTGSTVADDSGNGGTAADISGATWLYDQYSVDVYDNSTTTDGTFTVTQGKVEGLALSSALFDGNGDYIDCSTTVGTSMGDNCNNFSIAMWVKPDTHSDNDGLFTIGDFAGTNGEYSLSFNSGRLYSRMNNNTHFKYFTYADNDVWAHVAVVFDGDAGIHKLFYNGVEQTTTDSGGVPAGSNIDFAGLKGIIGAYFSSSYGYDGDLNDVRLYDITLSNEQVASLYSKTLPITPKHWWKMDEGTGSTANDVGTGTTANGTLNGNAALSDSNGTLDLNGTTSDQLRISANGTLSAPRGNLAIGGAISATVNSFENYGTFIHNNGTVTFDATADYGQRIQETASAATAFYNLTHNRSASSYHLYIKGDITVENILLNQVGYVNLYGPNTLTMGTTSSAGTITMTSSGIRFYNNDSSNYAKIYGASSIYPFVYTGNQPDIDTYGSNASHVAFKNGDIQVNMTSDYQGGIVRLDGDMEFDAVTVNSGDTLDLNGQRAEFSGLLSSSGTIACGTDALVVADSVNTSSTTSGNMNLIETGDGHTHTLTSSTITNWFLNGGTISNSAHGHAADNIIVGAGKLDVGNNLASSTPLVNVTTATGAELDGNTHTLTMSGDFTTSGGLIGKSALNLTGSEEVTGTDNLDEVATSNRVTVEAWFKATTDANYRAIFSRGTAWGTGNIYLYMNSDGNIQFSMHDLGATVTSTTAGLADGKWHHAAATYDQTNLKLYIDGKLEATFASTAGLNTQTGGFKIGDRSGANWEGQIGRVSIWDAALTEAQIREMLFYDFATADSEATIPDANCIGWWQFDEGTGTAVADSSTNNADGTLNSAAWAGAGTFTYGTSTLVFAKSGTQKINYLNGEDIKNLTVNDGSTTELHCIDSTDGFLDVYGNVTVNEKLRSPSSGSTQSVLRFREVGTLTIGSDVKTTALSDLYMLNIRLSSGTMDIPELTTQRLRLVIGATARATGDLTLTQDLTVNSGTTFNANGNTIAAKVVDINGTSTFTLGASALVLNNISGGLTSESGVTLNAGPGCTIGGDASGQKVPFESQNGFQIVGNIDDLNVTNEELTVIGTVTNCTGDILQFTPGHDSTLSLETDTAEDRDIRLGGPSLDNANHLIAE